MRISLDLGLSVTADGAVGDEKSQRLYHRGHKGAQGKPSSLPLCTPVLPVVKNFVGGEGILCIITSVLPSLTKFFKNILASLPISRNLTLAN
jgi:hypothetical protein